MRERQRYPICQQNSHPSYLAEVLNEGHGQSQLQFLRQHHRHHLWGLRHLRRTYIS